MGTAPDRGEHHRWKKGDLIIVDHFLWHQHFNDDPKGEARLVRVHMFDSILETMRALTDPLVLFEEAEDPLLSMKENSEIDRPDDRSPAGERRVRGVAVASSGAAAGRALAARPCRGPPRQGLGRDRGAQGC